MNYCKHCGVELEENANFCSLCGQSVSNKSTTEPAHLTQEGIPKKMLTDFQKLTKQQKRKIFWEVSGLILFSGMLITTTINFVDDQGITWSKYVIAITFMLFIQVTLASFLYKKLTFLFFLSFITSAGLLLLIDYFTGNIGWITPLGLPLLLAAYLIVFFFILIEKRTKHKGLNLIAYLLLALGLLCVCIDGTISLYTNDLLTFSWSMTVMVSAILTSSLLLYVNHRLKEVTDLKRFFHI